MCYTETMNADRHFWGVWSKVLQRWGVQDFAVLLLEGLGPLNVLAAQLLYIVQPLLVRTTPHGQMQALADMLEDTQETQAFIHYLREATHT